MIHFIPDRLLTARFTGNSRRYFNECVSLAVLLCTGTIWSWFGGVPANGLLPASWEKIRLIIHGGVPMCPLCGGTRSFLLMCRGEIVMAAHYNLFGVVFFCAIFLHLFLKIWALRSGKLPALPAGILAIADNGTLMLATIFTLWGVQAILHFTGIFLWYTVLPG